MNIGLIDVDGHHFPNLALMKLSAFHKQCGDEVSWADGRHHYDRVYASKVFDFTPDIRTVPDCDELVKGGTGYGLRADDKLPTEVEHIYPDYGLYGITDTAYGFLSRGCPRGCPFCIVAQKEGRASHRVANLYEFWRAQKNVVVMDPNLLACPDWEDILVQLAWSRALVDINQGLDIRLIDERRIALLNQIRIKSIHFAWDNAENDLAERFALYAKLARRKYSGAWATVYVLVNYNSTMEQNLYRIEKLREMRFDPYVMVYDKQNAPLEIKRLQRWCNNRIIFKSCKWRDYKPTRKELE